MAKLTQEQIDALPLSDFGEPQTRNFYITDQDDVNSAAHLIGKAHNPGMTRRRIIRIARRKGLTIPEAWTKEVNMSMDTMTDGDIRDCLNGAVSDLTADARHRVLHVLPMAKKVVYTDTNSGDTFQDDFEIDKDGNPTLKGSPEKVNVKRRTSVEPVKMAARFSATGATRGRMVVYEGEMFRLGNYPDKDFSLDEREFDSVVQPAYRPHNFNHEHTGFTEFLGAPLGGCQEIWRKGDVVFGRSLIPDWIHSLTGGVVSHSFEFSPIDKTITGCALTLDPRITTAEAKAAFSRFGAHQSDQSDTRKPMNLITRIANWARGNPEAAKAAGITETELASFSTSASDQATDSSDNEALRAEIAQLRADGARMNSQQVSMAADRAREAATTFAREAIAAEKFAPADEKWLTKLFHDATVADGGGSVKFSNGTLYEGSLCTDLRQMVKDRPRHIFTEIRAGAEALRVVFSDPGKTEDEVKAAQSDAYLKGTGTKERVEAARKGA